MREIFEFMQFLQSNHNSLMVIITFVYVVATVFICIFNAKSASAAKKQANEAQNQIRAAQKQQEQNVGIQLYAIRKDVLRSFSEGKYNEIFWDIPLLFNDSINDEFQRLCGIQSKVDEAISMLNEFENHIKDNFGNEVFDEFQHIQAMAEEYDDNTRLYEFCRPYACKKPSMTGDLIKIDYEFWNEAAIENSRLAKAKHVELFVKMQAFVKDSIAAKE